MEIKKGIFAYCTWRLEFGVDDMHSTNGKSLVDLNGSLTSNDFAWLIKPTREEEIVQKFESFTISLQNVQKQIFFLRRKRSYLLIMYGL